MTATNIVTSLMSVVAFVSVVILVRSWITHRRLTAAGLRRTRAFGRIGRLLPAAVRDEYCEEWAAWMADLRADGTPRVRRWLELLSLMLIAVPRLAVGLRWAALRRVVGR
jgi:hypothetical protein